MPTEQYFALVRQKLATEGQAHVRVTGDSMRPLLHHLRDGVVLAPPTAVRPGDVVLYDRRNGRYALHRVISIRGDRFAMIGDNQWRMDRDLRCEQIVAKVVSFQRNGRDWPANGLCMRLYATAAVPLGWLRGNVRSAVLWLRTCFFKRG